MSQIDSPKEKERNEISPAVLACSEGWAEGEVCERDRERGREEELGQSGDGRGSGTGTGVGGAEVRGVGRTERWGSQSTVTYGVSLESLGKTCLFKIYSAEGTKSSGGTHIFNIKTVAVWLLSCV